MTDARAKLVQDALVDLYSRGPAFAVDLVNQRDLGNAETQEIPNIGSLTVTADGATSTSAQTVTPTVLSLTANLHPFINIELSVLAKKQSLNGNWAAEVAKSAMIQLKNYQDEALLRTYLANTLCWTTGTAATYHDNVAGDALAGADILNCKAALLANDGTMPQNLALFVSSYGEASIMNISAFVPNYGAAEQGILGIPKLGSVYGIPVYSTNSVQRSNVVATTACTISSNVVTCTVASGHGLVAGQVVDLAGTTVTGTGKTITSTTATTVVFALTGADGAMADGVGTLTANSSDNIMIDTSMIHVAQQIYANARIVPHDDTTGEALQISALWGRVGRTGRARVLHSPATSA